MGDSFAKKYGDAMVSGIYAGGMDEISVACSPPFSRMKAMEQEHGSLAKAGFKMMIETLKSRFSSLRNSRASPEVSRNNGPPKYAYTFRKGMQTLPNAILSYLQCASPPVEFKMETKVDGIRLNDDAMVEVHHSSQPDVYDAVISAIPGQVLGGVLHPDGLCDPKTVVDLLSSMHSQGCVIVSVGFQSTDASETLPGGFGHLIPGKEGEIALGIIWHSSVFPTYGGANTEQHRFNVMMGGPRLSEALSLSDEKLEDLAREAIYKQLNVLPPVDCEVNISRTIDSIPHYQVGHADVIKGIRDALPANLQLAGASFDGVSVHDCVSSGRKAAEAIAKHLVAKGEE
uniref:Protoporphyrinogen oxidase n=1 Tax=Lotharella globosa TaxID=91324 RepID=A0A7S4DFH3_9EUKA